MARLDDGGLAALARVAPALQELAVNEIVGLDAVAPGSTPPWTMPHLTTLALSSGYGPCVHVVCAAALLARAPRLRGLCAIFEVPTAVPLEMHVRALAHIAAAAGGAALSRLAVVCLTPTAGLQAAMAVAAPGGIALKLATLNIVDQAAFLSDDQQLAWLCSMVVWVGLVDVLLSAKRRASTLSRCIFALPASAFRLRVPFRRGSRRLQEAVRFAVEAARPGQQVCVWAEDWACGTDAVAEAEAIARGALDKDIRVQIGQAT